MIGTCKDILAALHHMGSTTNTMDELLTAHQLQKYWQRQETLSSWTDSGYNSSNATDDRENTNQSSNVSNIVPPHGGSERQKRKPWVMNAFAMTAPGHLAPGT